MLWALRRFCTRYFHLNRRFLREGENLNHSFVVLVLLNMDLVADDDFDIVVPVPSIPAVVDLVSVPIYGPVDVASVAYANVMGLIDGPVGVEHEVSVAEMVGGNDGDCSHDCS